jgi:pyrophosphatase PpaX
MDIVLHDWDGTLFDSNNAVLQAYSIIMKKPLEYVREKYDPNWKAFLRREGVAEPSRETWASVMGMFKAELFSGANEYIERLCKRSKIGLVTGSNSITVSSDIKKYGLDGLFKTIVTYEDVKKLKPDPEGILIALKKMGVRNKDCCYVGDTAADAIASKRAKVRFVGVGWGLDKPDVIRKVNNDKVAHSFDELYEIVSSL